MQYISCLPHGCSGVARCHPKLPRLLLFILCHFFMALTNSTSLSCENTVNYDGVRTNQQNTMIARHFAALPMLISCDAHFIILRRENNLSNYNLLDRRKMRD